MKAVVIALAACALVVFPACSSSSKRGEGLQRQEYAKLSDRRMYEKELSQVWKVIESVTENLPVAKRDSENATQRTLETDWVTEESRDKFHRYFINGSPRQKKLKVRYKYLITAQSVIGGTEVGIKQTEEIEKLKKDGTSDGFKGVDSREIDTSRQAELLDRIGAGLLTAPAP